MWDADKSHKKAEKEQVNKSDVQTKTWDKCHKKAGRIARNNEEVHGV